MRVWLVLGVVALLMCAGGAPAQAAPTPPPTLTVQIIGQGTVTGTGINCGGGNLTCYSAYGTDPTAVTLTAAPGSGWALSHWENSAGATICAGSPPLTTCDVPGGVTGAVTITAVFTISAAVQTSTLTVTPGANGTLASNSANYPINCHNGVGTCSLTALTGSTITVVETPDGSYFFSGFGGACAGTAAACSVYLASDQSVSAGFVVNTSTNTLTVTVSGTGSVSGGGISCGAGAKCTASESANATVTLSESPSSGQAFTGWTGDCNGLQSTCTVQMNAARSVTATFMPVVPLAVTVTGSGYVTGGGIGCDGTVSGQTCTANETPGTNLVLTANPGSGGSVLWSGCTSTAGNFCTLTIATSTAALAVTATFSGGSGTPPPIATNSLTVSVSGDGYVTGSGGASIYCTAAGGSGCTANVQSGSTVTLTAVPASGTAGNFNGWTNDCFGFFSTTCTLTVTSSQSAVASFAGGNTTYILSSQVTGTGSISGAGLACSGTGSGCSAAQAAGAPVTLTATPSFGATFTGWSGACSGTSTICTVSMTTAKSVTATFAGGFGGGGGGGGGSVSLTVAVTGVGTVSAEGITCASTAGKTKTCEASYASGKKVTLTAKPAAGYVLSAWTGDCSGAKPTCAVTLAAAKSVGAKFVHVVLASTHSPTVVRTKAGYRVTLWFHTGERGAAEVVAQRAGKVVVKHRVLVQPGGRHVLITVTVRGHYVVTLTLAKHTLRWSVTV